MNRSWPSQSSRLHRLIKALFIVSQEDITGLERAQKILSYSIGIFFAVILMVSLMSGLKALPQQINPVWLVFSVIGINLFSLVLSYMGIMPLFWSGFKIILQFIHYVSARYVTINIAENTQPRVPSDRPLPYRTLIHFLHHQHLSMPLLQLLTHCAWLLSLTTFTMTLLIQFLPQHYEFYLGSTLQWRGHPFYFNLLDLLNWLPNQLGIFAIDQQVMNETLTQTLTNKTRHQWAGWILIMICLYGILPRLLAVLQSGLLFYYRWQRVLKQYTQQQTITVQQVIDPAPSSLPNIQRRLKTIHRGVGEYLITVDHLEYDAKWILDSILQTTMQVVVVNQRSQRQALMNTLRAMPAFRCLLIIDAHQTPDRGSLSLIADILDHCVHAAIYLENAADSSRISLWKEKLLPLLDHPQQYITEAQVLIQWLNTKPHKLD